MNDIVERLRVFGQHYEVCNEAADEIERLRLAVRDQAGVELSEENDRLIALNSWLEADKAAISWTASGYLHEITDWRACAKFDLLMEGPRAMGWDHSALERCREKYVPKGE